MKPLTILIGLILAFLGFLAGAAWKKADPTPATAMDSKAALTSNTGTASSTKTDVALDPAELATIRLFEKASPSVCYISTSNFRRDYFSRNVNEIPRGTGSGFVWDRDGHIITNYHVIEGADAATITLGDRSTWQAKLVGAAPEKDLAVLKIDVPQNKLIPIPLGSSSVLRVGQSVYAIGNPFGLDQSLTTGVVSALGREITAEGGAPIREAIQTDAAINPGNSGGPLLNSSGQLIGVNTAIYSPSGASAGIGFSIPVDAVKWIVPELIKYGKVKRPTLGVTLADDQIMQRLGMEGALVIDVLQGSGAQKAGIRATKRNQYGEIVLGDIIQSIGEETIKSPGEVMLALEKFKEGDRVKIGLLRDGKQVDVNILLSASE